MTTGTEPSSTLELPSLLNNLRDTIAQFSDGNLLIHPEETIVEESILRRFAPPGLEEQFQQLYSILYSNLHIPQEGETIRMETVSSSTAAILMGTKGSGKSLLLERCLAACQEQLKQPKQALCRQVSINGILCRGQDVGAVVYEIIRQLSEIAFYGDTNETLETTETAMTLSDTPADDDNNDHDQEELERQRRKRLKRDKHLLRLRKSAFTSNVALLESTLKMAHADGIPILLILDELDAFLEEGERQMLLYYFLDRVANPDSNILFIGTTSSFSTLTLLEKRIRSRAEGTAKVIYLRNPPTYARLVDVLQHKLKDCVVGKDIVDRISCVSSPTDVKPTTDSSIDSVAREASPSSTTDTQVNSSTTKTQSNDDLPTVPQDEKDTAAQVAMAMEREFRLGKDVRWYSRVLSTALSLYRHDCRMESSQVPFHTKYLLNALVMMGASVGDVAGSASKQPDLCIVNGIAVDPRLQALLDLSTPQVALLLAAKRILTRQSHSDEALALPLTMDRIMKEYESFRRRSSYAQFTSPVLRKAVLQMMDVGLIMPTGDHSGGGPFQYNLSKRYRSLDSNGLSRLQLQVPLDIERELTKALELNLLTCPTALKEWGKATA
ncbi:AAA ATPase domain containing protein [Nitzschia inconspicua]|uniref:AAA ATPase domain containing protein n=1 Tax=Nitzschia inconspicua TaxID=303405 RepID=A0A9K3LN59_9STRA|nr:AAA ATPase domain containing protein [Nitzschia inconspicua]